MNDPGDPGIGQGTFIHVPWIPGSDRRSCWLGTRECQQVDMMPGMQEEAAARARARKAGGAERAETGDPRISPSKIGRLGESRISLR